MKGALPEFILSYKKLQNLIWNYLHETEIILFHFKILSCVHRSKQDNKADIK